MIDPSARRSATVIASDTTVIARVAEAKFAEIGERHPRVWRLLAREIAVRLRERSRFVRMPNDKPQIFIGSSREAWPIADALDQGLKSRGWIVRVWTSGVFDASKTAIEALEKMVQTFDFTVLVFSADDTVFSRGTEFLAPRDNIIFELGLGIGALHRERSFIVLPHGADLKIPTDLLGVTPIKYSPEATPSLVERLVPACEELATIIQSLGPK